ncbi:MAG: GNAT family N-acetyltransferase [Micrococcales bacterium]|nr:GNAT family N-acetyltransferase [Micrococcales bacterium]
MAPYSLDASNCTLTPIVPADMDRVYEYCQDEEVQRWTMVPVPYRMEDAAVFTVEYCALGWDDPLDHERVWGIRVPGVQGGLYLAGSIGLRPDGPGSVEIGYLVAPDCRRRGLATAAVSAVVEHALSPNGLGMRRVLWKTFVGNWPSRTLAVRCGFTVEGTIRSDQLVRGEAKDVWIGTILASDMDNRAELWAQRNLVRPWT